MRESEFQADVIATMSDLNRAIQLRSQYRSQLERTENLLSEMTVEGTLSDADSIQYLLTTAMELAGLSISLNDQIIENLVTRRDDLAFVIREN